MKKENFAGWLNEYGKTWESKDVKAFGKLFSYDALYYWTPFTEPKRGRSEIMSAVESAISTQSNILFKYEILSVDGNTGVAHWKCSLRRITTKRDLAIDGILIAQINDDNLCYAFREWWHSNEFDQ